MEVRGGNWGSGDITLSAMYPVLVRKGPDGKAQLVLLDHGLYQFLDEK